MAIEPKDTTDQLKARLKKILLKGKNKKDNNPGAVQSTKKLKEESDIEKLIPFSGVKKPETLKEEIPEQFKPKRFIKKSEGPAPKFKRKTLDELKAGKPTLKRGGKVQKKSKKSGRLAKRGYGKSR